MDTEVVWKQGWWLQAGGEAKAPTCVTATSICSWRYEVIKPVPFGASGEMGNVTASCVPIIWDGWSWTGPKVRIQSANFCVLYTCRHLYTYVKYTCLTHSCPFSYKKWSPHRITSPPHFLCFLFLRFSSLFFFLIAQGNCFCFCFNYFLAQRWEESWDLQKAGRSLSKVCLE